ncbi:MAG: flagellin [Desulfuromonadaceae bacterium]|nr:flagellin [Desulfuromonadaceae bacterium]MDD5106628.1 flagellin [Desulfuromonadaceae bacterium]
MSINDISLTLATRNILYALTNTSSTLNQAQSHLATGKKVNSFQDNPTSFSAALSLLSRAGDLTSSKDTLNNTIQATNIANIGIQGMTSLLQSAQGIAAAAQSTNDPQEQAAYAATYQTLVSQASQIASDSGNGTAVTSALPPATLSATSPSELESSLSSLRTQSASMSASLGNTSAIKDFTDSMINTLKTGADNLTLADMNQEAANTQMLQTRQLLGGTSLGLSSQSAQSVLRLF